MNAKFVSECDANHFLAGLSKEEQPNPSVNVSHLRSFPKNDSHTSKLSLAASPPFRNEVNDFDQASATLLQSPSLPTLVGKQVCIHNGMDSSGEAQVRNGKCRGDVRGRNQLLPRYWPRITDKELQQISGTYPVVIEGILQFYHVLVIIVTTVMKLEFFS